MAQNRVVSIVLSSVLVASIFSLTSSAEIPTLHPQNPPSVVFEKNAGQSASSANFLARGPQYDVLIEPGRIVFDQKSADVKRPEVALVFDSSSLGEIAGEDLQSGLVNYYIGADARQWHAGVPTYGRIRFKNLYPGIDLVFYAASAVLEFDFIAQPNADLKQIRFHVEGAPSFSDGGDIFIAASASPIRIIQPGAYQSIEGQKREVSSNYIADNGEWTIGFGKYDPRREVVVDPSVVYQGYLPNPSMSQNSRGIVALSADQNGNAYVASNTAPSNLVSGPCVLTKLGATGSLIYQTLYGPQSNGFGEGCFGIASDSNGNAYVTGSFSSGLATTSGVVQPNDAGGSDAFVAKFGTTGQLIYGTYIGGSNLDTASGIAVDANGNAYITGSTSSNDFPLQNAYQSTLKGSTDAFVSKVNPSASALVYSTYLAGSAGSFGHAVAIDSADDAYVSGSTNSTDFPTVNPLQTSCNSPCNSGYLTKFDPSGTALVYSTYLNVQGNFTGSIGSLSVDPSGDAFISGELANGNGVVLLGINPTGSAVNFTQTLQPGVASPYGAPPVALDAGLNVYTALGTNQGATLYSFTNSGTMIYSFPVEYYPSEIAGAESGNAYLAGESGASYYAVNLFEPAQLSTITKISAQSAASAGFLPASIAFGYQELGTTSAAQTLTIQDLGDQTLDLNSIVVSTPFTLSGSTCATTLAPNANCALSLTFTPQSTNPATGTGTVTDNSLGSPHVIALTGQGSAAGVTLSPANLSFPGTPVGQSSPTQAVTLTNSGQAPLTISRIDISGDFSETNNCAGTVNAGQSCTISVTFTPTVIGTRTGNVTITDDASGSPQTIGLAGTGGGGNGIGIGIAAGGSSSATVPAGSTAMYQLAAGGQGFSGTATLACSGAPQGATCSVPSGENLSAATPTMFNVTVTTTSRTSAMLQILRFDKIGIWATFLLGIMVIPAAGRRRKTRSRPGLMSVALALSLGISSCGGGGSSSGIGGTPAGTYNLTVTATSGSQSSSVMLTLTVQ